MTPVALTLVLLGAACHALWNIVAKRAAGGGVAFIWLFGLISVAAIAPWAVWSWSTRPHALTASMGGAVAASALIHVLYSLALQRAYRAAPFSVVYPVARGSGPLFSVAAALAVWSERPSALGWAGVVAVLAGVLLSARSAEPRAGAAAGGRQGVQWGLLTGSLIAGYTLVDAWAIKSLGMSPLVFFALALLLRTALVTPLALRRRAELARQWHARRGAIVAVGVLSPLAYTLVLTAMRSAPLSYVAPVREVSMLVGTWVGARLLDEAVRPAQIVAAVVMVAGVVALAMA